MVNMYMPIMIGLLETKMKEHKYISNSLGFDAYVQFSIVGLVAGITVLWKEKILQLDNFFASTQVIFFMIKVILNPYFWIFSAIYTSPD